MRSSIVAAGLAATASASQVWTTTKEVDVTITSCGPSHTGDCYGWGDWSTSTSTKPVVATTTSTMSNYWGDWESTSTSSKPAVKASTTTSAGAWGDWSSTTTSKPAVKASTTTSAGAWGDWASTTTASPVAPSSSALCPSYTATGPPAWFSYLPSDVVSSISAKWTGAPPQDWCYYTYSTASWSTSTPVAPASTSSVWADWASTTAPAVTPVQAASGTGAWTYKPSATGNTPVAAFTGAASSNKGCIVAAGLAAAAVIVLA